MNKIYKTFIICAVVGLLSYAGQSFAGNRDRSGQAGAASLLIDPWARTNGWGNAGVAEIRGFAVKANTALPPTWTTSWFRKFSATNLPIWP